MLESKLFMADDMAATDAIEFAMVFKAVAKVLPAPIAPLPAPRLLPRAVRALFRLVFIVVSKAETEVESVVGDGTDSTKDLTACDAQGECEVNPPPAQLKHIA